MIIIISKTTIQSDHNCVSYQSHPSDMTYKSDCPSLVLGGMMLCKRRDPCPGYEEIPMVLIPW